MRAFVCVCMIERDRGAIVILLLYIRGAVVTLLLYLPFNALLCVLAYERACMRACHCLFERNASSVRVCVTVLQEEK